MSYDALADLLRDRIHDQVRPVLRIRWYDATDPTRRLTNPRAIGMAAVPGVRLVEGHLVRRNGVVQQKAVDTRLVSDMVTIAHQRQVDRFVLLTGDEDMAPGVEAAEDLGLHVEVWSIEAEGQAPTVSRELIALADTHRTIDATDLATVIIPVRSIIATIANATTPTADVEAPAAPAAPPEEAVPERDSTVAEQSAPAPVPRPIPRPTPPAAPAAELELPNLFGIDQAGYHRPVADLEGLTDQQRASRIGETYARRWWDAASEDARRRVAGLCPRTDGFALVPAVIDKDLLRFAEDQGLDTWTTAWVKTLVRNGWWDQVTNLGEDPIRQHEV